MPNFERGVYEPNDEVRVFDGSEEDEDMEGSRLPLLLVLALLVAAMFAGLVWLAYTQGVARGRSETPVLTAAAGPVRTAPQNPGGADTAYKGFKIYEQPAPPDEDGDAVTPPPAAPAAAATPAPAPAPVAVAKPVPAPVVAAPAQAPAKLVPAKPAPVVAPPKPAPVITAVAKPAPKPVPPPLKKAVAVTPAPVAVGPATGAPRTLSPIAATVTAPAAKTPAKAAATGGLVLQIGAYKSQADADAAWKAYKAKHAALLSGYGPDVQQADLGDKGTWYRLRIAGFPDRDVASGLCDRLKADGGSCFLGK